MKRGLPHKALFPILMAFWISMSGTAAADDGMWMPHQMKMLDLKAMGLQMNPDDLYKTDGTGLMSAVVYMGGGTGEFVSREGLILTNHHVAFGAVQRASSREHDYIRDGFLAADRSREISAPGYTIDVLLGYEDVTAGVLAKVKPGMTPMQKNAAVEKAVKEIVAKTEKSGKDIRGTVTGMYSGLQYYLFITKKIKDIRIVYVPPYDLGNFGEEVDNWMWPRHTCDFSFLRAYVAKDGTGADYSVDNVPYQPKSFFKISLDGVKEGDFTFVMGYPGRTSRNISLSEMQYEVASMARRIEERKDAIEFFETASKSDKEIEIRYAGRLKGLYNGLKNNQGKLDGIEKNGILGKKADQEKAFTAWVDQDSVRRQKYGSVLDDIADGVKRQEEFSARTEILSAISEGSTLLSQANLIVRAVQEFQKPDKDREPAFQIRNIPSIKNGIMMVERGYVFDVDKAYMKHNLMKLVGRPEEQIPAALRGAVKDASAVSLYVDDIYAKTILAKPEKRIELLSLKPARLKGLGDPLIALAMELSKALTAVREDGKALGQERQDLRMRYEQALLEQKEGRFAPDANSTIRFTCGTVTGYSPKDAVFYGPITSLKGVVEKDLGKPPFNVPERMRELVKARDFGRYADKETGSVPACFLNSTNVTGGNSGSPTLNAKGEQVGIIFDMTYESVIGDYLIIPELQRSISVDIRYVLFVTEKFAGATHIIKELGL